MSLTGDDASIPIQPPTPGDKPPLERADSGTPSPHHLQIPEARDGTYNYSDEKSLHHVRCRQVFLAPIDSDMSFRLQRSYGVKGEAQRHIPMVLALSVEAL
jgi:hypothetical protein